MLSRHKCKQCAKNKDIELPCLHSVTFFELTSVNSVSLASSWQWHRGKDMAQDRSVSSQVQTLRCTKDSTDTSCVMTALRLDCDWFVNILAKIPTSSGIGRYESCFLFWAVWDAFNSLQSLPMLTPPMSWVFLHHPSPLFIPPSWHVSDMRVNVIPNYPKGVRISLQYDFDSFWIILYRIRHIHNVFFASHCIRPPLETLLFRSKPVRSRRGGRSNNLSTARPTTTWQRGNVCTFLNSAWFLRGFAMLCVQSLQCWDKCSQTLQHQGFVVPTWMRSD